MFTLGEPMKFDPALVLKTRQGESMRVDDKDVTLGWLAVFALDNMNLDKCDGRELRRRFRIATEIQDAADKGALAELKSDEVELIEELVCAAAKRLVNGALVYGQFDAALADMREEGKPSAEGKGKSKRNGEVAAET